MKKITLIASMLAAMTLAAFADSPKKETTPSDAKPCEQCPADCAKDCCKEKKTEKSQDKKDEKPKR